MTETHFIVNQKRGVNHLAFLPGYKLQTPRLTLADGTYIVLFLAAFMALVFLLAR